MIGADGPYNDGAFRAKITPPISNSFEIWRDCASAAISTPSDWAVLRFSIKWVGWRKCAAISDAGLFAIRNGARGKGDARVKN